MADPVLTQITFLVFAAVAAYAQSVTGFALGLILLGLVGATAVVPVADAANAAAVLAFVNAAAFLCRQRPLAVEPSLWPAMAAAVPTAVAGVFLLNWLAGAAYEVLRLVLGVTIAACAVLLWRAGAPLREVSSPRAFVVAGALSGLLGGMFGAPGPPLVYLMYRQPLPQLRVRQSLIVFFGTVALLRLAVAVPTAAFSFNAVVLAAEAVPVVVLVTLMSARRPPPLPATLLKRVVCALLVLTGAGMTAAAVSAIAAAAP